MKYSASIQLTGSSPVLDDQTVEIGGEGIQLGSTFLDYAYVAHIRPINHRVLIDTMNGENVTVSMLGFSFDGFWEELVASFGKRTVECLFIEEELIMNCEAEYALPQSVIAPEEKGRGHVMLYEDSVLVLPESSHAVRIPLAFTEEISLNGYWLTIRMRTGEIYGIGKMGYDTTPFAERCEKQAAVTKKKRAAQLKTCELIEPFTEKGLFRTAEEGAFWLSAFGPTTCAVELMTGEAAATYLYRFGDRKLFSYRLEEAMEAVGSHREIIYLPDEKIAEKPLYFMAVHRSEAVQFLRAASAGRIIHTAGHAEKLAEFLTQ